MKPMAKLGIFNLVITLTKTEIEMRKDEQEGWFFIMPIDFELGILSVFLTLSGILFSSRRNAYQKDFFYVNPPMIVKRLLYWRKLPACKIALFDIIFRILLLLTLILQIISLFGICFLPPIFDVFGMEKYTPLVLSSRYIHTFITTVMLVILASPLLLYLLIVGIFAPKRIVHTEKYIIWFKLTEECNM